MKTIGLIGGMTWLSTMEYYRLLNQKIGNELGQQHSAKIVMHSIDFFELSQMQKAGRWDELATEFIVIGRSLQSAGADCLMIGANTMHRIADAVQAGIDIPLIHIGEATAREVKRAGLQTIGLTGTKYTMELDFYKKKLQENGIATIIPTEEEREFIQKSIFSEIINGILKDSTRQSFKSIIKNLVARGAQGVVLGCTEIPLLVKQSDADVPLFDTTEIHAQAAVEFVLDAEMSSASVTAKG